MTVGPSISTLTFFRGDAARASAFLRARLGEVLQANPWLTGALAKRSGQLELCYPLEPAAGQLERLFNPTQRAGKPGKVPVVDSTMSYMALCEAVGGSAAEILKGSSCINKPEPLLALTEVPDNKRPSDTFAVVFSVSHVIADGFTYYKLLAMLSDGGTIASLNAKRKHDIGQQSKLAMGEKEFAFAYAGSTMINVVGSMLFGKKPLIESYYVDDARIKEAKAKATPEHSGVPFVSTNDVLVSAFGVATDTRVLLMPLNFRERLPDFTAEDAGNYEGALVFGPEDYAEPGIVRKTLMSGPPTYLRGGSETSRPLPAACEGMWCRLAMVTNWTFPFFSEVKLEGCEQMLHMPHCDINMVPFDIAVVYRPRAGELAMTFFVRSVGTEGIKADCPVGSLIRSPEDLHVE